MSDHDGQRVRVNLRVDEDVKDAFDEEIKESFGKLRPYAGIELERECRHFLDRGDISELRTVIDDLTPSERATGCKEKIREVERDETTTVGYRIAADIRDELVAVATDDYRSSGELIEAIMYRYVTEGSVIERMSETLQQVSGTIGGTVDDSDSVGAKERRTKTIAAQLDDPDRIAFDLDDFSDAVEAASGIDMSKHVKQEYLPRVLDELNFTWDPEQRGRFIDCDFHTLPDVRDPTRKPYVLMDRDDKRLAIKVAGYRNTRGHQSATLSVTEAIDVLQGRPRRSTVRPLMREIADSTAGYEYSSDKKMLRVERSEVIANPGQNRAVIAIEHTAANWVESAVERLHQFLQEHDLPIGEMPDPVIDNKIASAKYPKLLDGDNPERFAPDYVAPNDRERVVRELFDNGSIDRDEFRNLLPEESDIRLSGESVTTDGGIFDEDETE